MSHEKFHHAQKKPRLAPPAYAASAEPYRRLHKPPFRRSGTRRLPGGARHARPGGKSAPTQHAHCGIGSRSGTPAGVPGGEDRKSTRLNSSHVRISYAVFCLKKKKKERSDTHA